MTILDAPGSLIFTFPFSEYGEQTPAAHTLEGLWWKHDPDVGGFVSLANATGGDLAVSLEVIGSAGSALPAQSLTLPGHATRMLDLDDLIAGLPGLETQQGGLRIQYNGRAGDLTVVGGLENRREGYSEDMPFAAHDLSSGDAAPLTYASLGLRVGAPDPAEGFPQGTEFTPYTVLRNTTASPLQVSPTLNYMAGGKPVSVSLPGLQLKPFESRQVDFPALLTSVGLGSFRGDVNLALRFTGHQGDLVLATGSVDQTGTYVFGVLPEGVAKSRSKESAFWTVAGGFDSTFTLWNPTGAAEDLLVTLYYADGSGKYKLPIHLEGQASVLVDVAQLVSAQQPDAEGHVIPATVQSGSGVVASAQGVAQSVTVVLSEAVFNVLTDTCANCCFTCKGISFITVTANPFSGPVGVLLQLTATATWNTGMTTNETSGASWSSNDTTVATVSNTSGSKGLVSCLAPGSCIITAFESDVDLVAHTCTGCPSFCPLGNRSGSAGGLSFTPIQHNYPRNPLPQPCWISSFFDAVRNSKAHHAEDVVYDNGQGTGGTTPAYGTPVFASESGIVVIAPGNNGPSPLGYPACVGTGSPGNYVKIKSDSDNYFTIYFHVKPSVSQGQHVNQGDPIGTLDNSGCQSGAHVHVGRKDPNGVPVNFTLPCTNPTPTNKFFDGLVDDDVPDNL